MKSKHKIAFVHAPKTGGTSLDRAIRRGQSPIKRFRKERTFNLRAHPSTQAARSLHLDESELRRSLICYYLHMPTCEYVAGHFSVTEEILAFPWSFITILRDPVDRWFSEYYYNRYKGDRTHAAIEIDLKEFLVTDEARRMGTTYVRMFAGISYPEIATTGLDQIVKIAESNLEKFSLVGFTDALSEFRRSFQQAFGKRLVIPHKNKSPAPGASRSLEIDDNITSKVRELTVPDQRIYSRAREIFSNKTY